MFLLLTISTLCFITAFINFLTKPIIAFLSAPTRNEKLLIAEIKLIEKELADIPMRSQYKYYVQTERSLVKAQTKLNNLRSGKATMNLAISYGVPYGGQFILSFIMIVLSILYRYTPVIVLDGHQYDLVPFGGLINFPTGIDGAVSVPFWIFVNSYVSKHVASYICK